MPGFQVQGSAVDGQNKNNRIETRRKHRWRFTAGFLRPNEWIYLEKAARPSFQLENPEMHHDQEVAYFAGKQTFEEITLEFYDAIGGNVDVTRRLYEWIAGGTSESVVNLGDPASVNIPASYKTDIELEMTDGQGNPLDAWTLFGAWPKSTNWNDLDYTNTEIQRVTVVLKFDRAVKTQDGSTPSGF